MNSHSTGRPWPVVGSIRTASLLSCRSPTNSISGTPSGNGAMADKSRDGGPPRKTENGSEGHAPAPVFGPELEVGELGQPGRLLNLLEDRSGSNFLGPKFESFPD